MQSPTIGIVIFPDAEELDFVGPWEVFTMAKQSLPEAPDDLGVVLIAQTAEPVRCAKGMRVLPDHTFDDAPDLDIVLVPGGIGTRSEADNPVLLEWLAKIGPRCDWITSVCTGALLLQRAGLVTGKRITTHWGYLPTLREEAPEVTLVESVRYVRDGNVVTAAGVSAGIDMALWLTGQIWDVERARITQRLMEYSPAPPYATEP